MVLDRFGTVCLVKRIEEPLCPEDERHSTNAKKSKRDSSGKETRPCAETSGSRQKQIVRVMIWLNCTSMLPHKRRSSKLDKSKAQGAKRRLWILVRRRIRNQGKRRRNRTATESLSRGEIYQLS